MNWLYLTIGFLSFPILAFLFMLWIRMKSMVYPSLVQSMNDLQNRIKGFYHHGKGGEILYIQDQENEFIIRVIKMDRKLKEDTLRVEIRASDKNSKKYDVVKDTLISEEIEFEEKLTPKLKKPSRILIKNDSGGIYTISAVSQTITHVMKNLSSADTLNLLISDKDPYFWKKLKP